MSASPTPLPSGVIHPQPLIDHDTKLGGIVIRVDKVATKLTTMKDAMDGAATGPTITDAPLWAVAIVGAIKPEFGVVDTGIAACGVFFHDAATGDVRGMRAGSLSLCQPYFAASLAPADAPVHCATNVFPRGVFEHWTAFTATRAGAVRLDVIRDDSWRGPTVASGTFLAQAPEGGNAYLRAFCIAADVRQSPAIEKLVASGLGDLHPDRPFPHDGFALWLRDRHALGAAADGAGHVNVTIEPKAGFEWAFFDWNALVGQAGYVQFRLVDPQGHDALPWIVGNGG